MAAPRWSANKTSRLVNWLCSGDNYTTFSARGARRKALLDAQAHLPQRVSALGSASAIATTTIERKVNKLKESFNDLLQTNVLGITADALRDRSSLNEEQRVFVDTSSRMLTSSPASGQSAPPAPAPAPAVTHSLPVLQPSVAAPAPRTNLHEPYAAHAPVDAIVTRNFYEGAGPYAVPVTLPPDPPRAPAATNTKRAQARVQKMTTDESTSYDESRRLAQADRRATERERVEADKAATAATADARYLAPEKLDDLSTNPRITMISPDDRCTSGFREARKDKMEHSGRACIVTGMMFIGAKIVRVAIDDFPWAAMDRVLRFPPELPEKLKEQYRIVDLPCPAFVDPCTLALSDRGVVRDAKCKIIAGYFLRDAHDALIKIEKELKSSRADALLIDLKLLRDLVPRGDSPQAVIKAEEHDYVIDLAIAAVDLIVAGRVCVQPATQLKLAVDHLMNIVELTRKLVHDQGHHALKAVVREPAKDALSDFTSKVERVSASNALCSQLLERAHPCQIEDLNGRDLDALPDLVVPRVPLNTLSEHGWWEEEMGTRVTG
ncbi:hypothetical protein H9P43_009925 [Blastocladiella emersonii ATCC 22665]|nr:hypothetical protein H9P43_009925 [Blastocladiella emersonii ATCC 22665]